VTQPSQGYFATVAGFPIVSGELMIPLAGCWTADVHLASANDVSGPVEVVIGNLTLQGTVYRSQAYGGQTRARIVGGKGGWRTVVDKQGYGSGSGVKVSHILGDVASACGETVNVPADTSVGNSFTRAEAIASDVLWQLVSLGAIPSWYVDNAGVTQAAYRPTTTIATPFTVTDQKPDQGLVVVATEDYASWLPGCTFTNPLIQGSYVNGGVNYVWTNDGQFRFEVLTGTSDRLLAALNALIDRKVSPTKFYGRYQYTISNPTTTTVDATPVDDSIGLPDLQGVPIVADSISVYTPPDGGECHIEFLNGNPNGARCVWTEGAPSHTDIMAGTTPAAKLGDTVQSMVVATPPNLTGFIALGVSGPMVQGVAYPINPALSSITILSPVSGTIVTGSAGVGLPL
jgi:hypothetical protein